MTFIKNSEKLDQIHTDWVDVGPDLQKEADPLYLEFTDEFTVNGTSFDAIGMSESVKLEKLVGKRKFSNIKAEGKNVGIGPYHKGYAIDKVNLNGDSSGLLDRHLNMVMRESKQDKTKLATAAIEAGFTQTGYDDLPIFDTGHARGSNIVSAALTHASLNDAIVAGESRKDSAGKPLGYKAIALMVPVALETTASDILGLTRAYPVSAAGVEAYSSAVAVTAIPNSLAGRVKLIVNPWLTETDQSYVLFGKPVLMGVQAGGDMVPDSDVNVPNSQDDKARFWVTFRAGVAMVIPELITVIGAGL